MAGDEKREQDLAAAERVRARTGARAEKIEILSQDGGLARADTEERIAKRMERLARYLLRTAPPESGDEPPAQLILRAAERLAGSDDVPAVPKSAAGRPDIVLERVINNADFLAVRYLDAGTLASRAVGRIIIRDAGGDRKGYGTASLVSPRLLLTNHHVLPDATTAAQSLIEFNHQDDIDGIPMVAQRFALDPEAFFVADKERDFALVAVKAGPDALARFGFNPLIRAEGKAIVGERVTIVQHPGGEPKQLVLRDQQIVDIPDTPFLYYLADTERGSSGSPVFNDQWEVVALHHAGVPNPAPADESAPKFVNEGVRISRILKFVDEQPLPAAQRALFGEVVVRRPAPAVASLPEEHPVTEESTMPRPAQSIAADADGWVQITVPLEIKIRLGAPSAGAQVVVASTPAGATAAPASDDGREAIVIDQDFAGRGGFDTTFLGAGHEVALPTLSPALQPLAAIDTTATSEPRHVLRYHHYSVVMNKERRLAFWTGVNIDGAQHIWRKQLVRKNDRWFFDPRLPRAEQTGEEVYARNDLDRGHLVRRLDPAWGADLDTAKKANDDTFHFTNATPQHKNFNQNDETWQGLEDYILDNAAEHTFKASIFNGPVFADDDDVYRGVKLPRQFWKVAVMVKKDGTLSATAYLLSQAKLIEGLEADEEFSYGAYKTFQVKVSRIATVTGLSFGDLADADPLERLEASGDAAFEIASLDNLIL